MAYPRTHAEQARGLVYRELFQSRALFEQNGGTVYWGTWGDNAELHLPKFSLVPYFTLRVKLRSVPDSWGGYNQLISSIGDAGGEENYIHFYMSSPPDNLIVYINGLGRGIPGYIPVAGDWIEIVSDPSNVTIYVNGTALSTTSQTSPTPAITDIYLNLNGTRKSGLLFDVVERYSQALSETELAGLRTGSLQTSSKLLLADTAEKYLEYDYTRNGRTGWDRVDVPSRRKGITALPSFTYTGTGDVNEVLNGRHGLLFRGVDAFKSDTGIDWLEIGQEDWLMWVVANLSAVTNARFLMGAGNQGGMPLGTGRLSPWATFSNYYVVDYGVIQSPPSEQLLVNDVVRSYLGEPHLYTVVVDKGTQVEFLVDNVSVKTGGSYSGLSFQNPWRVCIGSDENGTQKFQGMLYAWGFARFGVDGLPANIDDILAQLHWRWANKLGTRML